MNSMYNHKKAQIAIHEKMLRDHKVDPSANDEQAIADKEVPHREGHKYTITEGLMESNSQTETDDSKIIEKVLNEAKSYIVHRSDAAELSVPPINAVVEKKILERRSEYWHEKKEPNWTVSFDDKKQQGKLPRFPKNAPQNDKIVLNNDPRRFENADTLPIHEDQQLNDATHGEKPNITPLVGTITRADVNKLAEQIKTGESVEYDAAIVAILKEADRDSRELTDVEQKTVSNLKIARTKALLQKK